MTDQKEILKLCESRIAAFESKADHNKRESLRCFILVIVSTLLAPMFVMLGQDIFLGKIIPSILSLLAAGSTAWLQLRKPQQLWTMYRTAQRELEDHHTRYLFHLEPYEHAENPSKKLAAHIAEISLRAHYQWMQVVPNPETLKEVRDAHMPQKLTVVGGSNER